MRGIHLEGFKRYTLKERRNGFVNLESAAFSDPMLSPLEDPLKPWIGKMQELWYLENILQDAMVGESYRDMSSDGVNSRENALKENFEQWWFLSEVPECPRTRVGSRECLGCIRLE